MTTYKSTLKDMPIITVEQVVQFRKVAIERERELLNEIINHDFRKFFETSGIKIISSSNTPYDIYNTPYRAFTSGAYKEPEQAIKDFQNSFISYLNGRRNVCIRCYPELRIYKEHSDSSNLYYVFCRFTAYLGV